MRNFLYSDVLRVLHEHARVTLLSSVTREDVLAGCSPFVDEIVPLHDRPARRPVGYLRTLVETAHFRWLWSEVARNTWQLRQAMAHTGPAKLKWYTLRALARASAGRRRLEALGKLEQSLSWRLRPTDEFVDLLRRLRPDVVFNCSHIHGPAADLPMRTAYRLGIPTVGFVFSWDNLTSRSRILVPYDYYVVWSHKMRSDLLRIYPQLDPRSIFVTGTPQFDFLFDKQYWLDRKTFCELVGLNPSRPFILYTTGIAKHFPEEHRTVRAIAETLLQLDLPLKPQLVVRRYAKDTSAQMHALGDVLEDVVFPPILWDLESLTPLPDDTVVYTNLLRHAAMGINAASTVSLELMMVDKPVLNLGFDPPGSSLPAHLRWRRHIDFDHYRPVAESGAVMVARSEADLAPMLLEGLTRPERRHDARRALLTSMFGHVLDSGAARRVANCLLQIGVGAAPTSR